MYRQVNSGLRKTYMYRCHFTQRGRIVFGENLEAESLPEAVTIGRRRLEEIAMSLDLDGLEIWENTKLIYASAGERLGFAMF
jgi:hypothetical protein